jgi:hypothetical protein
MDPFIRKGVRPQRLLAGAAIGALTAVLVIAIAGAWGAVVLVVVGVPLTVVFVVGWVASVVYLRSERGRVARDEYLARQRREPS